MKIARFWAHASDRVEKPSGESLLLKCWGWSTDNLSEAQQKAQDALERLASRVRQGEPLPNHHYGYGDRALREEMIREISTDGSDPSAMITRNSYGALILNTSRMMFIDVDVAAKPPGGLFSRFKSSATDPVEATLTKLRQGLAEIDASFRIYRTAAGYRVLATDPLFDPASQETERIMQSVDADPAFVNLCRAQQSFRARLTPKPWRCGQRQPPAPFPRENGRQEQSFRDWLEQYEGASQGFAVCRWVEDIGPGRIHDEVQPLLALHDELTRCDSKLQLA